MWLFGHLHSPHTTFHHTDIVSFLRASRLHIIRVFTGALHFGKLGDVCRINNKRKKLSTVHIPHDHIYLAPLLVLNEPKQVNNSQLSTPSVVTIRSSDHIIESAK
jgi:hypothetical protein